MNLEFIEGTLIFFQIVTETEGFGTKQDGGYPCYFRIAHIDSENLYIFVKVVFFSLIIIRIKRLLSKKLKKQWNKKKLELKKKV